MAIDEAARELVKQLAERQKRIVFAESCTGGMISAEIAKIPGVSDWLCGSAVTYRCDTKVRWIGVNSTAIEQHTAVSAEVATQMASGVLERTPEADVAASVTGHLGPDAPEGFDGVVFVGLALRDGGVNASRFQLAGKHRGERQVEAAELVMKQVLEIL